MGQAKDTKRSEKVRAKGGAYQGLQELREGEDHGTGQAKDSQEVGEDKGQ